MQIDLLEFWTDPQLNLNTDDVKDIKGSFLVPPKIIECMWKPDTMFQNAKEVKLYADTAPNIFYKVMLPGGILMRRSRYKITAACPMKFHFYPMDTQVCSLQISLHHSRKNHVRLGWSKEYSKNTLEDSPMNFAVKILPQTKRESLNAKVKVITEFLDANFLFERSISAALFNTYTPSLLVVCLSMVSFWLDVAAVPGRVTLGVTSILTLSTQIVRARSGLPVLDYMTAMDVWLLSCLIMVFLSLVEFTFAHSYSRNKKAPPAKEPPKKEVVKTLTPPWVKQRSITALRNRPKQKNNLLQVARHRFQKHLQRRKEKRAEYIQDNIYDRVSRILFPMTMFLFSCFYWLLYYNAAYKNYNK